VGTASSTTRAGIWTAFVATSAAGTVTLPVTTSTRGHAICVEVWSGAALAGTPATASLVGDATSPFQTTLTTVQNSSVVSYAMSDWNAIDPATTAFSGDTATPSRSHADTFLSGGYTAWWLYQTAAAAGVQTIGLSAPAGLNATTAAIEIQDASGGGTSVNVVLAPAQQDVRIA
jgi:hypothetical protein